MWMKRIYERNRVSEEAVEDTLKEKPALAGSHYIMLRGGSLHSSDVISYYTLALHHREE
jgi:hypothetical protein